MGATHTPTALRGVVPGVDLAACFAFLSTLEAEARPVVNRADASSFVGDACAGGGVLAASRSSASLPPGACITVSVVAVAAAAAADGEAAPLAVVVVAGVGTRERSMLALVPKRERLRGRVAGVRKLLPSGAARATERRSGRFEVCDTAGVGRLSSWNDNRRSAGKPGDTGLDAADDASAAAAAAAAALCSCADRERHTICVSAQML